MMGPVIAFKCLAGVLVLILAYLATGSLAIRCYVCAPVPEIGATCASASDGDPEECGSTTDSCHVLFVKQPNGAMEITRNCGKFKGPFQARPNECQEFVLKGGGGTKLCNCQQDGCNTQTLNPQELQQHQAAQPLPTPTPSADGGGPHQKPTAGDTHKLPIYNPSLAPLGGSPKSPAGPAPSGSPLLAAITAALASYWLAVWRI